MKNEYKHYPVRIVVIIAGWVLVGRIELIGSEIKIHNARCIRVWGTTGGLAQLAANGPLADTKLEPASEVSVNVRSVVYLLECSEPEWRDHV